MTENFPYYVPHPTSWLVLGPYEILIGWAWALFVCDALALTPGGGPEAGGGCCASPRVWSCGPRSSYGDIPKTPSLWPWPCTPWCSLSTGVGPERVGSSAPPSPPSPSWSTLSPRSVAVSGTRQRAGASSCFRLVVPPSLLLLATPLAAQFHATTQVLVQAAQLSPNLDHSTPWTAFAPRLGGHRQALRGCRRSGTCRCAAGGGLRGGWWACRWRQRPELLVWAADLVAGPALPDRIGDGAVLRWPTLALGLVLVAARPRHRRQVAGPSGSALDGHCVWPKLFLAKWSWWYRSVTGGLLLVLLPMAFPGRASRVRAEVPIDLRIGTDPSPCTRPVACPSGSSTVTRRAVSWHR